MSACNKDGLGHGLMFNGQCVQCASEDLIAGSHIRQCIECGSICASTDDLTFHINRYHAPKADIEFTEPYIGRNNHICAIVSALGSMSDSEVEIIAEIVDGIQKGRKEHGTLDLATDTRDFKREAWEEIRDLVFYLATIAVKEKRQK